MTNRKNQHQNRNRKIIKENRTTLNFRKNKRTSKGVLNSKRGIWDSTLHTEYDGGQSVGVNAITHCD